MFYPIGFIVVILGRAQLFTENTLYPVALVLAEKKRVLEHAAPVVAWCCRRTCRGLRLRLTRRAHLGV